MSIFYAVCGLLYSGTYINGFAIFSQNVSFILHMVTISNKCPITLMYMTRISSKCLIFIYSISYESSVI